MFPEWKLKNIMLNQKPSTPKLHIFKYLRHTVSNQVENHELLKIKVHKKQPQTQGKNTNSKGFCVNVLKALKLDNCFWREKHCFEYCRKFPISLHGRQAWRSIFSKAPSPDWDIPQIWVSNSHNQPCGTKQELTASWATTQEFTSELDIQVATIKEKHKWKNGKQPRLHNHTPWAGITLVKAGPEMPFSEKGNEFYFWCANSDSYHNLAQESRETTW